MKKIIVCAIIVALTGCGNANRKQYLPEAQNDKIITSVGISHRGDGYTIDIPEKDYRYERDFDDGGFEEKWEYKKRDDVQIKVTSYKNTDETTARARFLRENKDYIFEDLMGYSVCGTELDGDTLWFNLHQSGENVYIVSWEYPKNTDDQLKMELSAIVETFKLAE